MKTSLILLSLLVFLHVVRAQKMPSDYFEEASKFYEDSAFDKALDAYQYIVDKHSKNELYPRAFYNMGCIYFKQKEFEKAIAIFKSILTRNFNERENLGGDIMDDPYTNFKHRASEVVSDIYYEREKYDSALYYFVLSDTAYPYLHFCGNAYAEYDVYTALRYADIYQQLKQPEKAIAKLLPAVFITLANNEKVIEELQKLLKSKPGLKSRLDESLNRIRSKEFKQRGYSYSGYYIEFLGAEIAVPEGYDDQKKKFDKQKAIKAIKETDFYKMISEL